MRMVTRTEQIRIDHDTLRIINSFEDVGWRVRHTQKISWGGHSFLIVVFERDVS